jgi:hypothetical protein
MKHSAALLGVLGLFAAMTMLAQTARDSASEGTLQRLVVPGSSCPIGMRARHDFSVQKQLVNRPETKPNERGMQIGSGTSMQIRLTLSSPDARRITAATITVRGTNGNGQMLAARSSPGSADLTKTMDATFEPGEGHDADSHLVLRGFSSIGSIRLDSVAYSDGSRWKTIDSGACRVAPDPLMLVATQ